VLPGEKTAVQQLRALTGAPLDYCHMAYVLYGNSVDTAAQHIITRTPDLRTTAPRRPRKHTTHYEQLAAQWRQRYGAPWPQRPTTAPQEHTVTLPWLDWAYVLAALLLYRETTGPSAEPYERQLDKARRALVARMQAAHPQRGPVTLDAYAAARAAECMEYAHTLGALRNEPAASAALGRLREALHGIPPECTSVAGAGAATGPGQVHGG